MALVLGGACTCPVCGGNSFREQAKREPDARLVCLGCGHVSTIEEAIDGRQRETTNGSGETRTRQR